MWPGDLCMCQTMALSFLPVIPLFPSRQSFPCDRCPPGPVVSASASLSLLKLSSVPVSARTVIGEGLYLLVYWSHGFKYCIYCCPSCVETLWRLFCPVGCWRELSVDTAFAVIAQRSFRGGLAWENLAFRVTGKNLVIMFMADKVLWEPPKTKSFHMLSKLGFLLLLGDTVTTPTPITKTI